MRTVAVIFTDRRIPLSEVSSYKKYRFLGNYDIISPLDIIEDPRYNSKMMVVGFTCDTDRVQQGITLKDIYITKVNGQAIIQPAGLVNGSLVGSDFDIDKQRTNNMEEKRNIKVTLEQAIMGKLNAALSVLDIKFKKNLSISLGGVMAADFGEIMHSMDLTPYESWQGAPINNVIALCDEVYSKDKKEYDGVTLITDSIKINLKEEYTRFFDIEWSSTNNSIKSYKAYVINTTIYNWAKQNKV